MRNILIGQNWKTCAVFGGIFLLLEAVLFFVASSLSFRLIGTATILLFCFFAGIISYYGFSRTLQTIKENKPAVCFCSACVLLMVAIMAKSLSDHSIDSIFSSYVLIIQLILLPALILGIFGIYVWKLKAWKLYLIIGTAVGIAMMLMIPVGGVPDEVNHIASTYRLSNTMLGIQNGLEEGHTYTMMRADDAAYWSVSYGRTAYLSTESFNSYINMLLTPLQDSTLIEVNAYFTGDSFCYILPALGITLGRILGLGTGMTLMLGRVFNFAAFMALTTFAVKMMPVGKLLMVVLLLMPMTVQQGMSYSYDVYVIGISMLIAAYTLKIAFAKEWPYIKKREMVLLAACCLFMFPMKGKAYFLVCLLPWAVMLYKKFPPSDKVKTITKRVCIILLLALVVLYVVWGLTGASSYQYEPNMLTYDPERPLVEGYSIGYFIAHPFELISVFATTIVNNVTYYVTTFVGGQLGWLDIIIPRPLITCYYFLILFASMKRMGDEYVISKKLKKAFATVTILTIGFILAGMLLHWSPIENGCIVGVQGRYFIPVAIFGSLIIYSDKLQINRKLDKLIWMILIMAIFCVVEYLIVIL